jgi:hypothetical protein
MKLEIKLAILSTVIVLSLTAVSRIVLNSWLFYSLFLGWWLACISPACTEEPISNMSWEPWLINKYYGLLPGAPVG